ncbi:uncharacterized protein STEHIDRAFT_60676, partial [Stereum hirsutum FP-91666 SS1]|uniref:uncharacterized protein n=1 Tax=Stereum hirsutum (strain FP-91666) TaxID=721885 RepID=UPI000444972B
MKVLRCGDRRATSRVTAPVWILWKNGHYTYTSRRLIRSMTDAGCAQNRVGPLMRDFAHAAKILIQGRVPSRRTVGRVLIEGGVMAKIQLAFEIRNSPSNTISSDGTSDHGLEYLIHFIVVYAPESYSHPGAPLHHLNRMAGFGSILNKSSDTQLSAWKRLLSDMFDTLDRSPLGRPEARRFCVTEFLRHLKGMLSDHAADQKRLYRLLAAWKAEVTRVDLGWNVIHELELLQVMTLFSDIQEQMVNAVGGQSAWDSLSPSVRDEHISSGLDSLAFKLGSELYPNLPADERHEMELMFWAGCSMHKELNAVSGADQAIQAYWSKAGVTGPILLANRDNAATIRIASQARGDTVSAEAARHAIDASSRGACKAGALFGAYCNHSNSKDGVQDNHRDHFQFLTGIPRRFPDTSNIRYQCYLDSSCELLARRFQYQTFLELMRDRKTHPGFTNLEQNCYNSIVDIPTLTEMAALVVLGNAVCYPFMHYVRDPGSEKLNVLSLGPIHTKVKAHLRKLIADPSLVLNPNASWKIGCLNSREWEHEDAMNAVWELAPQAPHLTPVTVRCLQGALETWERFSEEFNEGGLIAGATGEERELGFMPSTNDHSE